MDEKSDDEALLDVEGPLDMVCREGRDIVVGDSW
jgi:hypothetical protein